MAKKTTKTTKKATAKKTATVKKAAAASKKPTAAKAQTARKKDVEVIGKNSKYTTEIKEYVIGRSATARKSFKKVIIEGDIKRIEQGAFSSCEKLETVEIRDGVTEIGRWAFKNCPNLTTVVLPGSLKEISGKAFSDCPKLTTVEIPYSVESIESTAFVGAGLDLIWNGTLLSAKKRSGKIRVPGRSGFRRARNTSGMRCTKTANS